MGLGETHSNEIIGFIGAGKLGMALSRLLDQHGFTISSIIDKDPDKARRCKNRCHASHSDSEIHTIESETRILFIAVPDDEIPSVTSRLQKFETLSPGTIIAHTSGVLSSDILSPLKNKGIHIGSFHPCCSFSADFSGGLNGVYIALEGEDNACSRLSVVAQALGGIPFAVHKDKKALYHAGCTMASNYLISLMGIVRDILRELSPEPGFELVLPLIKGTLKNIENSNPEDALTGPIVRGDVATIRKHLEALKQMDQDLLDLYIAMGKATMRLLQNQNRLSDKIKAIQTLFRQYDEK